MDLPNLTEPTHDAAMKFSLLLIAATLGLSGCIIVFEQPKDPKPAIPAATAAKAKAAKADGSAK